MKYLSLDSITNAYMNFQGSMTNKSWGILCIIKQLTKVIEPSKMYEFSCSKLSNYIENLFCLSNSKKEYPDNGKKWYIKFSTKWYSFFANQGQHSPNIFDVIVWVYRKDAFPDSFSNDDLISRFVQDFNLTTDIIQSIFRVENREITYSNSPCSENILLSKISNKTNITGNNITAEGKSVAASVGELSRGPFIQPLYAALDTTDYFLISQANFDELYPFEKKDKVVQSSSFLPLQQTNSSYAPLLTALRTKPFVLLAGISGTGKSRIVRELAKACWPQDSKERTAHKPRNYEMVQVRPNWHDSSELLGYVSRIGGEPQFVAGDLLKFVVRAWEEPSVPYFLCLDEMNLAPVEQYFAEFLSVIETRKLENGTIVTDPLLKRPFEKDYEEPQKYDEPKDWYWNLINELTTNENLKKQFRKDGIAIPQNLFVVGTVNMDETTFSFSRKVLDRAMTIEMNEVDLYGGFDTVDDSEFGVVENLIPRAVEGKDVYTGENKVLCDEVLKYLEKVNEALDGTPFKIAYRTRNEFLVYAVIRGAENLIAALDEMTSMKILSRIEGDSERTKTPLEALEKIVNEHINTPDDGKEKAKSISAAKIAEMLKKLESSGYTSFWS